ISEQLNVLALQEDGQVTMILPLAVCPGDHGDSNDRVVLIGENSAYPRAEPLSDPKSGQDLPTLMQQCLDEAGLKVTVSDFLEGKSSAQSLPQPRSWFGLNRRNAKLHADFQRCVAIKL
ncbi:MAG: hypothetical protein AB8B48_18070, partial [Pseudomonadales bacterium]